MSGTISIPQRERRIKSPRSRFHNGVGSVTIHTIDIRNLIRLNQSMIETGIEVCLFIIGTLYFDTAQITIPFIMRSVSHSVKVPGRNFRFQVLLGSGYARSGKGHFHHQLVSRLYVESSNNAFPFLRLSHRKVKRVCNRTIKFYHKEIILIHPYGIIDMSGQRLGVFPIHLTTLHV